MSKGGRPAHEDRNRELVKKRVQDPTKWTWRALGSLYRIHWTTAKEIFERDFSKYAAAHEVRAYYQQSRSPVPA